ncbi:MAG TPA: glycosyltransferase family 1 protein [Candidatus Angelobacter sp.]|nr:glycosyltransferase family 1 protein [Candidatus Angelobacter sp.]
MKIAIDVHSLGTQAGGNETYFRQLVRGLAADPSGNHYTLFHTHPIALEAVCNDPRFTLCEIPKNPISRLALALPRKLRQIQPDVFHCQYVQPLWGTRKTVVAIHDLAHEHFPEFFHPLEALRMKKMVRWTAKRASHILTISEFSAADIAARFHLSRDKITVTYLSPSPEFHPRDKQQCAAHLARTYGIDGPFILYVGRIQARKNLPRLVEAYASIRKQGITARLVIVGKKDWQFEQLLQKIHELGLESPVIFPGFVPFDDLPLFYNAAEVFVFPSFFEGFGLPVIESMASGVPTITSFGSSLQEVAGDGALLIDPSDTSSIATALQRALSNQGLRRDLINRGLQRARLFQQDDLAKKALAVYRSLL